MANRKKSGEKNAVLRLVAVILVIIMILTIVLESMEIWGKGRVKPSKWFSKDPEKVENTLDDPLGGMTAPETVEGKGISLMCLPIPIAQFDEYGISPIAESAITITATVEAEDDAQNTDVAWALRWKNASSEWASGKSNAEYFTLAPQSDNKKCNISCLQAFGEQGIITVYCVDAPEIYAEITLDYVQKLEGFTLSFGDVQVNLGGTTNVNLEVNEMGQPQGGLPNFKSTFVAGPYTIAASPEVKYELSAPFGGSSGGSGGGSGPSEKTETEEVIRLIADDRPGTLVPGDNVSLDSSTPEATLLTVALKDGTSFDIKSKTPSYNIASKGIYFGTKYLYDNNIIAVNSSSYSSNYKAIRDAFLCKYNNAKFCDGKEVSSVTTKDDLLYIKVTVTNKGQSMEKTATFHVESVTNSSGITSVKPDRNSIEF